jgi:hypothetical protein
MTRCNRTLLSLAVLACVAAAAPSEAASERRARVSRSDSQSAEVERLNQMSLDRARQGLNAPTPGPDTTSNLNRMSEDAARRGRNMGGQAPMPFR